MTKQVEGMAADVPAIGISIQQGLDDTRSIVFQAHVPFDCSETYLNGALDKLFKASNRQRALLILPGLRKRLDREQTDQKRAQEDMLRLDVENDLANSKFSQENTEAGRRLTKVPPQQLQLQQKNRADRTNAQITYERKAEEIRFLQSEIADLERSVSGE